MKVVKFLWWWDLKSKVFDQKLTLGITMAEISISTENIYFGGDCSILLEFSQFLDML
jgi:hypothetical protein